MARKSSIKDLDGNIINLLDETNGGYIIRNRQVVNPQRWEEIQKMEADKREAAKAAAMAINNPNAPDRTVAPRDTARLDAVEKRLDGVDGKLDAILAAISKK